MESIFEKCVVRKRNNGGVMQKTQLWRSDVIIDTIVLCRFRKSNYGGLVWLHKKQLWRSDVMMYIIVWCGQMKDNNGEVM